MNTRSMFLSAALAAATVASAQAKVHNDNGALAAAGLLGGALGYLGGSNATQRRAMARATGSRATIRSSSPITNALHTTRRRRPITHRRHHRSIMRHPRRFTTRRRAMCWCRHPAITGRAIELTGVLWRCLQTVLMRRRHGSGSWNKTTLNGGVAEIGRRAAGRLA